MEGVLLSEVPSKKQMASTMWHRSVSCSGHRIWVPACSPNLPKYDSKDVGSNTMEQQNRPLLYYQDLILCHQIDTKVASTTHTTHHLAAHSNFILPDYSIQCYCRHNMTKPTAPISGAQKRGIARESTIFKAVLPLLSLFCNPPAV